MTDPERDTVPAPASGEEHAYVAWLCSSQERARRVLRGAPVTPELLELRREGLRRSLTELDGAEEDSLSTHDMRRRIVHGLAVLEGV